MRSTTVGCLIVLVAVFAMSAWAAQKRTRDGGLCSVKSVFVAGNSESANIIRRDLEKLTRLKLQNDESKADAKFAISEQRIE